MYYLFQVFITSCFIIKPITAPQEWIYYRYGQDSSARNAFTILHSLMEVTYADLVQRERDFSFIRFTYEYTPHYEMGYVFGEIIERYKKIVEQFKRGYSFKNRNMYEYMDLIEQMQKMFFEIFHLVAMMHEIPQKYKAEKEYAELTMTDEEREQIAEAEKAFFESAQNQKKEAKKKLKAELAKQAAIDAGLKPPDEETKVGGTGGLKNMVEFNLTDPKQAGLGNGPAALKWMFPHGPSKPFPLDYGWDIEDW